MAERGNRYVSGLDILLRDAQPTWWEIGGEPNAQRRKANQRRADLARDELLRRYEAAEAASELDALPRAILELCENWRRENGGELPSRKGGAPADPHWRMMLYLAAHQAVQVGKQEKRGTVASLEAVADRAGVTYETVRAIYYDRDPEWSRAVSAELSRRKHEARNGMTAGDIDPKPTPPYDDDRLAKSDDREPNG